MLMAYLEIEREGVVDVGRDGEREEAADQMSPAEAWQGKPCSSTSSFLVALSSSSMLLPAKLHKHMQLDGE